MGAHPACHPAPRSQVWIGPALLAVLKLLSDDAGTPTPTQFDYAAAGVALWLLALWLVWHDAAP